MWLRNIKLKWDKSAPRRAASNPQLISPVVAPHHCAPLFSMTMCQIWAFWKHFPYAIIGSLLSKRKTEKKKNGMFYTKGTESLHFYLSSLSMAYYTLCFLGDLKEVRGGRFEVFITIAYLWTVVGWLWGWVWKRRESLCWAYMGKNFILFHSLSFFFFFFTSLSSFIA